MRGRVTGRLNTGVGDIETLGWWSQRTGGVERESSMNGHGSCRVPILSETEVLRENSETNGYGLSLCRRAEGGNRFEDHAA